LLGEANPRSTAKGVETKSRKQTKGGMSKVAIIGKEEGEGE
jgi:hypothetical protein